MCSTACVIKREYLLLLLSLLQEMSDKDLVISLAKKTQELEARIEQLEARQPTATSSTAGGGGAAAGSTSELEGAVPI